MLPRTSSSWRRSSRSRRGGGAGLSPNLLATGGFLNLHPASHPPGL